MSSPIAVAWLTVLVPLAVAVVVASTGRLLGRLTPWVTLAAPLSVLAIGARQAWVLTHIGEYRASAFAWLDRIPLVVHPDHLNTVMLIVVGVVASCVVVFSAGYMAEDPHQPRYFALLALFCASMSLIVMADNLIVLLAGWELVGTCSYLLIGFWHAKPSAANAAIKAFLVTHVGDAGMLLGIALLWTRTHDLSLQAVLKAAPSLPPAVATGIALLILLGAIGKSAQFPLHFWLPDAMEGPTPVSALIHAATMVAAGVFLVARLMPLFQASPVAMGVVLTLGAFTAIFAATIAVAQSDIKKVLAYSTISQLGFMFAALGVGAVPAAMLHLVMHAAFKALLFLGAGSVIHGTGTQELREMGGLAKKMPVTTATWLAGALALAGVPPLAGFFSKDAVVAEVLHASPVAGVTLLAASLLTAFYIARATRLAFFGAPRGDGHAHEGGLVMTAPLVLLAAGAVGLGAAVGPLGVLLDGPEGGIVWPVAAVASGLAVLGLAAGWFAYAGGAAADEALADRLGSVWTTLRSGYGYDAAISRMVVRPALWIADLLFGAADRATIDASAEGVGALAGWAGGLLSKLQTGDAQWYGVLMGAGVVVMFAFALAMGR